MSIPHPRSAAFIRMALTFALCGSALTLTPPSALARSLSNPNSSGTQGTLHPARGPQLLRTVPANAFPIHHGFGDARFGVVEAFEAPHAADALHVGWERVQVRWDELQPHGPLQWDGNATKGPAPFNQPDAPYDYELAHGRQLVGVIQGVPAWAAQDPHAGNAAVPSNLDLPWSDPRNYFGQFVFRAVRHYRGRIDTFVILNEVNIASGPYHQFAGSARQYAQLLRVAYLAAHAANPHVEVHIYGDSVYADEGQWFNAVLDSLAAFPGARQNDFFFDAAEVHLYSSILRWDTLIARWHALMRAHGFDRSIWMSETNVSPRDDKVAPAFPANHNTPLALQPNFLIAGFAAALGLGMPRAEVYRMLDPQHIWPEHPNGLMRRDGSSRPEYYAFQTANTWFAGVTATRYEPCATPFIDKSCLFRVLMKRPGQEIEVLWNQGGVPLTATVPALASSATLVQPDGATRTISAQQGRFTLQLPGATDRAVKPTTASASGQITSLSQITYTSEIKIGTAPQIVVQDLPQPQAQGQAQAQGAVPGLQPLFVERDRTLTPDAPTLGPVTAVAYAPDGSGTHALADVAHDRVLIEDGQGHVRVQLGGTGGAPGQFRGPSGVAIGPDGTLYVADQGNARIQEFDLQGQLLGGFGAYEAGVASLQAPTALAVASDGTLFVVDAAQDAVLHVSRFGVFLGRWGTAGYGVGQLDGPGGIAVDARGHVFVADTLNNRVVEYDAFGHQLAQVGSGAQGNDAASLHWPTDVTVRPGGGLAIADAGNQRIVVVSHPDTYVGSVTAGGASAPGGLVVAADGSYFVSDTARARILHLDAHGQALGAFGSRGFGQGQLFQPMGLALGPDGNLYVADSGNNRIEVLTTQGAFVRSIGRQGHAAGQFLGPHAVSVAPDGSLWVADTFNARIEHLGADGQVMGLGTPITGVNGAWGVATDGRDGVYYSAHWGQRVYHWTPSSQQGWGGPGSGAGEFMHPGALASAPGGETLYAVDEGNSRVQVIQSGRVSGQRGSADPGVVGLSDPVAVAVAPDGTIAVLDATRQRIVRYAGATAGGFSAVALPDVPLALANDTGNSNGHDASGFDVVLYGTWSGTSVDQHISQSSGQAAGS